MGIEERIRDIVPNGGIPVGMIKKLVVDVLQEALDSGHDLGGMGEYGRGWNDRGMQMKMIVKEMMGRWRE